VACFEEADMHMARVPGIRLPQRNFADDKEHDSVIEILHEQGKDTVDLEDDGKLYADLYVAAAGDQIGRLVTLMHSVETQVNEKSNVMFIQR